MADHSLSLKRGRKGASLTGGVALGGRGCANTLTTTVCLHLQVGPKGGRVGHVTGATVALMATFMRASKNRIPLLGRKRNTRNQNGVQKRDL